MIWGNIMANSEVVQLELKRDFNSDYFCCFIEAGGEEHLVKVGADVVYKIRGKYLKCSLREIRRAVQDLTDYMEYFK